MREDELIFFFSSRRRHTRFDCDWSSDVCSSDLLVVSHDFNKDLYCNGVPALFAGLMKFNADHQSVLYVASKVTSNSDGSQWTFITRKDSKWSDGSPCTARDFEWSWKRQLDPASAAPYAAFLYDIRNAQAFNKKEVTDPSQVGVRAKDDWTLEVTLEGPRGYFPVLAAYLAAL